MVSTVEATSAAGVRSGRCGVGGSSPVQRAFSAAKLTSPELGSKSLGLGSIPLPIGETARATSFACRHQKQRKLRLPAILHRLADRVGRDFPDIIEADPSDFSPIKAVMVDDGGHNISRLPPPGYSELILFSICAGILGRSNLFDGFDDLPGTTDNRPEDSPQYGK